jgi:dTDP-4-dehydrorhamnose 3,5-epimerase
MKFLETKLKDAFVIELETFNDERGFFSLSWSQREFAALNLNSTVVECNISFNLKTGTLRGMHFQTEPNAQAKLVRCTRGAIYDVIIDLRQSSETFKHWFGTELTAENHIALYVPQGFAHGFQTLEDNSEVFYQMSSYYAPESASGVRWNDPAFNVQWPGAGERIINARDQNYPDFVL